ncbi:MAG: hypothetical protein IJF83_13735 [Methanobrevibacter sp.]|nr:hypothetical protein [Methanobrevibacter sp.]
MKFKKIIIITLLLLAALTISSVSANENVDNITSTDYNAAENLRTAAFDELASVESDLTKGDESDNNQEPYLTAVNGQGFSQTANAKATSSNKLSVSAPTITVYYKVAKYFKVTVKNNGKSVKNLKVTLKVYTGNKIRTYSQKTNDYGVARFNTDKLSVGTHKVVASSSNSNYKFTKTSKIVVKKKSSTSSVKNGKYKNKNSITVTVKDGSKTIKIKCLYKKSYEQYLGSTTRYGKKYSVYVAYESKNGMQNGKKGWWTSGTNAGMEDYAKMDTRYNRYTPVTTLILD